MNAQPVQHEAQVDPLECPGVRRLLLSEGASRFLSECGEAAFLIVGRASFPACPNRWAIYLQPISMTAAKDACGVALGTHRAVRVKVPKAAAATRPGDKHPAQPLGGGTTAHSASTAPPCHAPPPGAVRRLPPPKQAEG